jgi:hypothetical protein
MNNIEEFLCKKRATAFILQFLYKPTINRQEGLPLSVALGFYIVHAWKESFNKLTQLWALKSSVEVVPESHTF